MRRRRGRVMWRGWKVGGARRLPRFAAVVGGERRGRGLRQTVLAPAASLKRRDKGLRTRRQMEERRQIHGLGDSRAGCWPHDVGGQPAPDLHFSTPNPPQPANLWYPFLPILKKSARGPVPKYPYQPAPLARLFLGSTSFNLQPLI